MGSLCIHFDEIELFWRFLQIVNTITYYRFCNWCCFSQRFIQETFRRLIPCCPINHRQNFLTIIGISHHTIPSRSSWRFSIWSLQLINFRIRCCFERRRSNRCSSNSCSKTHERFWFLRTCGLCRSCLCVCFCLGKTSMENASFRKTFWRKSQEICCKNKDWKVLFVRKY